MGLIHPESHFTELRAKNLRYEAYRRLYRHWQFKNELSLFEIDHHNVFGVHIYGRQSLIRFLQGASLYHPDTVTRSLHHDGLGSAPGVKDEEGRWDLRPHAERVIEVTESQLATWAALIDEPGTPSTEARMLYPVNRASAHVLDKIAAAPRLGDVDFEWTRGWEEDRDRKFGFFKSASAIPGRWEDVILQGPHLTVATPLFKQPNETMRNNLDTSEIKLEEIDEGFIQRTSYQRAKPYSEYIAAYPKWHGEPSSTYFRIAWREMAQPGNVRTLHAALLAPGPTHVHAMHTFALPRSNRRLALIAGVSHSITADFMVKVIGSGHVKASTWLQIPAPTGHSLEPELLLRTLRLNCLVQPYAALWEELYDKEWQNDSWVPHIGVDYAARVPLGEVGPKWEWATPLRRAADRRQALVEIDAIVAIMLGITAGELLTIYRTQFPVLQKYERDALYDANGRQLPGKLASEYRKKGSLKAEDLTIEGVTYVEPFVGVDRERDMELAHKHFSELV